MPVVSSQCRDFLALGGPEQMASSDSCKFFYLGSQKMELKQTYVGSPDPEAQLYVYYIWEDYKKQKDVPKAVMDRLASAGRRFRKDVLLVGPVPGDRGVIRSEITEKMGSALSWEIGQSTPGLLLAGKPLKEFNPQEHEWAFFSLAGRESANEDVVEAVFVALCKECERRLEQTDGSSDRGIVRAIFDSIELKPNFLGIGIDLKVVSRIFRIFH